MIKRRAARGAVIVALASCAAVPLAAESSRTPAKAAGSDPAAVAASPVRGTASGPDGYSLTRATSLDRIETPVTPAVAVPGVIETYVQLHDPLPASDASHPAACDWIGYLRLRSAGGPANSPDADAVMTLMPGDEAGAALSVNQGRLVVQEAAARGKHVEVWIINRRSACLVDNTGLAAAAAAHDYHVALSYYYGGASIGGHIFGGFLTSADAPALADLGLAQTLEDWRDVIVQGMPDGAMRQQKMFCGGHSLGGPITAALADWNFAGTASDTAAAGYNLCAGFFGEDTLVSTSLGASSTPGVQQGIDIIGSLGIDTVHTLLQANAIDRIQEVAPVLDPEVLLSIQGAGIQAFYHPTQASDFGSVLPGSLKTALQFFLFHDPR